MITRISGITALLIMTLVPAGLFAQDEPAVKVDKEASEISVQKSQYERPIDETTAPVQSIEMEKPLIADPVSKVIATWDGGKMTNVEVSATLSSRRPESLRNVTPEVFVRSDRKTQLDIVKKLVWEQVLLQAAVKEGFSASTPEVAKVIAPQEEALLNRMYYQSSIIPELNKITRETAREYYDANKDKIFTQPAESVIRVVHVSTDEMVTTEKGDTLEVLAKKISGDAESAKNIIDGASPFYLRETPAELKDKVLSTPLEAGEVLFVPRDKDAVSSASKLAEDIRTKLKEGKSIEDVIADTKPDDFSVSSSKSIRIIAEAGYYDEFLKAADSLKDTSVSEVIKTPRGLDILVLEDRITTNVIAYDQVEEELVRRVTTDDAQRQQAVEKTRKQVLDRLWKKFNVELNTTAIARSNYLGADPLSTDTVIARIGDFTYTLDQYLQDLRLTGKDWGQLSEQERLDVVHVATRITNYVIARDAKLQGLDKTPEFKKAMQGIIDAQIVAEYRKKHADPEDNHVTKDELMAFYNDNLDKYTSPAQVTLREISKRINMAVPPNVKSEAIDKAKKSLAEIRSRINNEEDFAQLARRESEAISTRSRGGLVGTVAEGFRGEAFKNQIRQLKPGEISEPFLYGSEVMIVRLDDRIAPTAQPFESVRKRVMMDYAAMEPTKKKDQRMEDALKAANVEIKF